MLDMGRKAENNGSAESVEDLTLTGPRQRAATHTSSFGVSKRESHDSSLYYGSKMYAELGKEHNTGVSHPLPNKLANSVICGDSRKMTSIPNNSVHLMVTSPPYNASKDYDQNLGFNEYLDLLRDVFSECYRVLVPGGRAVINVANLGRKPYVPLSSHVNLIMNEIGFLQRGEIIWDKSASAGVSCAWGSFASASNPCLRDVHEYILIFSKGEYKLPREKSEREVRQNTIDRKEFVELTKSIWRFPTVSAKRVGHPAPFPVELPRRCIEMYTFTGDVVLDPFLGSGSTAVAAVECGRKYIGVDLSQDYCHLAEQRIAEAEPFTFPEEEIKAIISTAK